MESGRLSEMMNRGLESLALSNLAITVSNLETAIGWYCTILNFELVSKTAYPMHGGTVDTALLSGGGFQIKLLKVPNSKKICELFAPAPYHLLPVGSKLLFFQVEDLKTASRQLESKGVRFVWREKYHLEEDMFCSLIEDMDGNKISIFQKK